MNDREKLEYFKVNERMLDIDIKKSELWVYLTHCSHGSRHSKGYSIAGLNAVQEFFGKKIRRKTYDKAIKNLAKKELKKILSLEEADINTGVFKINEVIEVSGVNIKVNKEMLNDKTIADLRVKEILNVIKNGGVKIDE